MTSAGFFYAAPEGGFRRPAAVLSPPAEAVCFVAGTLLAAEGGARPVESLHPGDLVVTLEGEAQVLQPVVWLGWRRLALSRHPRADLVSPVRIHADAFAGGVPARDLLVSPDHGLLADGILIPARRLVNGMTVTQETGWPEVTYFHVELARHAILLAEDLPAESYLDTGNRAFFANVVVAGARPDTLDDAGPRRWATDACAPLARGDAAARAVWTRLAERAAALGHDPARLVTTAEPDLRLTASGRSFRPVAVTGRRHAFVLPHGLSAVTITSRAGRASDMVPYSDDTRVLGVAVGEITLCHGAARIDLPVDHPLLDRGWHPVERAGAVLWRWTDGAARLPLPPTTDGVVQVDLTLRGAMAYRMTG